MIFGKPIFDGSFTDRGPVHAGIHGDRGGEGTGHSYEGVERYILDFARVSYLLERGMPPTAIRTVLGCSMRLVEKYVELYRRWSRESGWRMGRIRLLAQAHLSPDVKKTARRKAEGG